MFPKLAQVAHNPIKSPFSDLLNQFPKLYIAQGQPTD